MQFSLTQYFFSTQNNNIEAMRNFSLAFSLMGIIKESFELRLFGLIWTQTTKVITQSM